MEASRAALRDEPFFEEAVRYLCPIAVAFWLRFRSKTAALWMLRLGVAATFGNHAVTLHVEVARQGAEDTARDQFERGFGAVIGVTLILTLLHGVEDFGQMRITFFQFDPNGLQPGLEVRLPRLVGHRHDPFVAHDGRVDVLVGRRVLEDRAGMQPGLVGKGRGADIGRLPLRDAVQDIVQHPADPG